MARIVISFAVLLSACAAAASAAEPQRLDRIVVTPSRIQSISGQTGRSITVLESDAFKFSSYDAVQDKIGNVGGIDIRRRGPEGVQSDISIRGATFEQNSVLIDGIPVNDSQTGHHTMDLPMTALDAERVEILKGPASSLYGPNSFGGVINVMTKKPAGREIEIEADGGSFDYFLTAMSASTPLGPLKNRFSCSESRSSGYMPQTEFNIFSVSDSVTAETGFGAYDFFFGYLKKDFGADSFYSNLFPNEEEHTDTRFFKLGGEIEFGSLTVEPKLWLRRHWDKFMLDTNRPGWQTNYHTTYNYGGAVSFVYDDPFLDAAYGYELSADTIDSTNLQKHNRTRNSVYFEVSPHLLDGLYLNAGVRADGFSDFGWEFSPSASAAYTMFQYYTVRASVGRSYRIPTFTDLYYRDAANIGNADLAPESSWSYDAGLDYKRDSIDASATFFMRNAYDTIDWIRMSPRDPWRVSNIGAVDTTGFECSVAIEPKKIIGRIPLDKLFFNYTVLDSYRKHDYFSKYALDYLKQQISAGLEYTLLDFKNIWVLNYKKRIGDSGYIVVDTKLSKDVKFRGGVGFEAFLEITNLFDIEYSEQSDIPMPGRWIRAGAKYRF